MRFKSAINRAPRQKTPGWPGEKKSLKLELKVLADVGLLGMPNAGKSTLISAISNARPRIADYPFTTLHPNLGVVRVGPEQSFVVADLPGLIEGASEGAGLGHLFLRHLQRTRLLLHVIDMAPFDEGVDPVAQAKAIVGELKKYDKALYEKPRWLVLNKLDMVPATSVPRGSRTSSSGCASRGRCSRSRRSRAKAAKPLVQAIYQHVKAQQVAEQPPTESIRVLPDVTPARLSPPMQQAPPCCATRAASSSRSAPASSPTRAAGSTRRRSANGAGSSRRWCATGARS